MESFSFKLFVPALVAALIFLLTTTPVNAARSEDIPKMYVLEEVSIVEPKAKMMNIGNQIITPPKMMIMQVAEQNKQTSDASLSANETPLKCAQEGEYCNTLFGNSCCPGIACVQAPIGGGVCHKW